MCGLIKIYNILKIYIYILFTELEKKMTVGKILSVLLCFDTNNKISLVIGFCVNTIYTVYGNLALTECQTISLQCWNSNVFYRCSSNC